MSLAELRKAYGTDTQLVEDGVWFSPPHLANKRARFLLARMHRTNKVWQTEIARIHRKYQPEIDAGDVNNPDMLKEVLEAFCRIIIKGWEGMGDDPNFEVPYTVKECIKLLDELPDLYDVLAEAAGVRTRYQQEATNDVVKK